MNIFLLLPLLTLGPLPVAHAGDCAAAKTQVDMNACVQQAYKKTDAELNGVYKRIMGRLENDKEAARLLTAAQRQWLVFRDAECGFASSAAAGGSIYPMLVTQCRDKLTGQRIKDLTVYLGCQEGDMGCPVPAK